MRRYSIRLAAFKWVSRKRAQVRAVTPITAYQAGYKAAVVDMKGCQYKRSTRVENPA